MAETRVRPGGEEAAELLRRVGSPLYVYDAEEIGRRYRTRSRLGAAVGFLEQESLVVLLFAVYCVGLLVRLPTSLLSDSWMTLLYGRELWQHGLPRVDHFMAWTDGRAWVDQQWLAQALFGGVAAFGGVKAALLLHAALLGSALGLALVAARRLGGSARSVPLVAAVALPALIGDWVLRAQSIAYVLFALLVWLLVADARAPSRRVLVALPLLALWANVHGSVVLAAGLVALRGLTLLRTDRARGAALVVLPWACVFASPYGLGLVEYYRSLFLNPTLGMVVTEWAATTPSLMTAPFYILGFATVALVARRWRALSAYEHVMLMALLANGLLAVRNMVWFSVGALVVVPALLDDVLHDSGGREAPLLVRRGLPLTALVATAVVTVAVAVRPSGWFEQRYPEEAARSVAVAAAGDPTLGVFAEPQYADWLVWRHPELRGRVAFDARLELLTPKQLVSVYFWRSHIGKRWDATPGCRAIVLLNLPEEPFTETALLRQRGTARIYRDRRISVLVRRQPRSICSGAAGSPLDEPTW